MRAADGEALTPRLNGKDWDGAALLMSHDMWECAVNLRIGFAAPIRAYSNKLLNLCFRDAMRGEDESPI